MQQQTTHDCAGSGDEPRAVAKHLVGNRFAQSAQDHACGDIVDEELRCDFIAELWWNGDRRRSRDSHTLCPRSNSRKSDHPIADLEIALTFDIGAKRANDANSLRAAPDVADALGNVVLRTGQVQVTMMNGRKLDVDQDLSRGRMGLIVDLDEF